VTREPSHTLFPNSLDASRTRAKPFGNFHVLIKLAEGAMGVVWVAAPWDRLTPESLVVVKTLRADVAAGPEAEAFRDMFLAEARLAMRLEHRHIVRTFEAGFVSGSGYFAMEYLRGQTLHRLRSKLRKHGSLPLDAEVRILADTVAGLHYAHTLWDADGAPLGVVHRDVAAQNIFVPYAGETKLLDFGVARASATAEAHGGPIALAGRVRYMAPEQARRERSDPRGDIFAAGLLLAEAITGDRFWKDGSDDAILEALRENRIPDPFHADHDPALVKIVRAAIQADPDARPQTIHALRTDLESWLNRRPTRGDLAPLRGTMATFFAEERGKAERTLATLLEELAGTAPSAPAPSEHRILAAKPREAPVYPASVPPATSVRSTGEQAGTGDAAPALELEGPAPSDDSAKHATPAVAPPEPLKQKSTFPVPLAAVALLVLAALGWFLAHR